MGEKLPVRWKQNQELGSGNQEKTVFQGELSCEMLVKDWVDEFGELAVHSTAWIGGELGKGGSGDAPWWQPRHTGFGRGYRRRRTESV